MRSVLPTYLKFIRKMTHQIVIASEATSLSSRVSGATRDLPIIGRRFLHCAAVFGMTLLVLLTLALPVATTAHAQTCAAFNDGLVGHWTLDETSTTTASDSSGNGNDGTMQNGMNGTDDTVSAIIGTGLDFIDADNHYIDAGSDSTVDDIFAGGGTISVWINPRVASFNSNHIVIKTSNTGTLPEGYDFVVHSTNERVQFRHSFASGRKEFSSDNNVVPQGEWSHVAVVYDRDLVSNVPKFYVNGVEVGLQFNSTIGSPVEPATSDASRPVIIGSIGANQEMDDLRMYDRALSAEEIATLYATRSTEVPVEGEIVYNLRNQAMQYCDGTDWRMMGIGSYNPDAVVFDGTNDYLDINGLTFSSSTRSTYSFWFKRDDPGVAQKILDDGSDHTQLWLNDDGTFAIFLRDATNSQIVGCQSDTSHINSTDWHHMLISLDSATSNLYMYVDDVEAEHSCTFNSSTAYQPESSLRIGEYGSGYYDGALADFWMDIGTYIDLSDESNRRKFISENGMPTYLGHNGAIPTGSTPDIFLSGNEILFSSNRGTGGAFTVNGALSYSSSQPGDALVTTTASPATPYYYGTGLQNEQSFVAGYAMATDGNYAYVTNLSHDRVTSVDVSDPANPFIADVLIDGTNLDDVRGIDIQGDYLFVTAGTPDKFVVIDKSDPYNLVIANGGSAMLTDGTNINNPQGVDIQGDYAYVATFSGDGIAIINISDPENPSLTGAITSATGVDGPRSVAVKGNYAYLASGQNDSFVVIDVSDPTTPVVAGGGSAVLTDAVDMNEPYEVQISGDYAFVTTNQSDDIVIIDISNPASPAFANIFSNAAFTGSWDMVVAGDYAYVTADNYFTVVDVSNPLDPAIAYSFNLGSLNLNRPVAVNGRYAYTTSDQGTAQFNVFDLGNNGVCSMPNNQNAVKGTVKYNGSYNVMNYCNGAEWVAMGPVGGTLPSGSNLVAHWKMDESSGTAIADSSGNGYNGTFFDTGDGVITTGADNPTGVIGTSLRLWASTDTDITIAPVFDPPQQGTIALWVMPPSTLGGDRRLLGFADDFEIVNRSGESTYRNELFVAGASTLESNISYVSNEWVHLAFTYDIATGDQAIYVNGVLDNSWNTTLADPGTGTLTIGDRTGSNDHFGGAFDDVRIYDRVLSPKEIQQIYMYGVSGGLGDVDNGCANAGSVTGATAEGVMLYNADNNVLQYCNGEEWIKIGY